MARIFAFACGIRTELRYRTMVQPVIFSENSVGIVEIQVKFLSNALSGDGLRIIQKCSNAVAVKA